MARRRDAERPAELDHPRSPEDPCAVLGISPEAGDDEIRAAYLARVREHPPDRDGAEFERIRDAYERVRSPQYKASRLLEADPMAPFESLIDAVPPERRFVGPEAWLAVLREGRK